MPHIIEEKGIAILIDKLTKGGHKAERMSGTFDLKVDGIFAEVKTKGKSLKNLDFISLTEKQFKAAGQAPFDIYLVCGLNNEEAEIYKISSKALLDKRARTVVSYEFDRTVLVDALEVVK